MLDFNDASAPLPATSDQRKADLLAQAPAIVAALFPAGQRRGERFLIGNTRGEPGDSLEIALQPPKAGLWYDHATGEGGDLFDLIAAVTGLNVTSDFPAVLEAGERLIGRVPPSVGQHRHKAPRDTLGPYSAKWDYHDAQGSLIACVYRYDLESGKKEYRPWDVRQGRARAPHPRPLYNQPGMVDADTVVLFEGEKCAQALIEQGIVATTAMNGAKAPVAKTDWSPLAGKAVLIWPDLDEPGQAYAKAAAQAVLEAGAASCAILLPPEHHPSGWDAADAIAEGVDVAGFIAQGPRVAVQPQVLEPPAPDDPATGGDRESCVWGTEDHLALGFTRRYHKDWRYVAAWGKWLMWDGQRWRPEETLAATDLIRHVCREASVRASSLKVAAKLGASSTVGGVERLARSPPCRHRR